MHSMNLLYGFESHITIDPVEDDKLVHFKQLCGRYNFRVADLLMAKGTPSNIDQFATGHGDYSELLLRMINLLQRLNLSGFRIRRYKIEMIMIDSRKADLFELLEG